jgi:hypothetical protein
LLPLTACAGNYLVADTGSGLVCSFERASPNVLLRPFCLLGTDGVVRVLTLDAEADGSFAGVDAFVASAGVLPVRWSISGEKQLSTDCIVYFAAGVVAATTAAALIASSCCISSPVALFCLNSQLSFPHMPTLQISYALTSHTVVSVSHAFLWLLVHRELVLNLLRFALT